MEEIKVGEYARTEEGEIFKVIEEEVDFYNFQIKKLNPKEIFNPIVKHSFNIIDLIELGDYVNGNKIIRIDKDPFIKGQINLWIGLYEMDSNGDRWRIKYTNNEIKSIVTKELMKSVEYRLED